MNTELNNTDNVTSATTSANAQSPSEVDGRKFYKTTIMFEVLSETPYEFKSLEELAADTNMGDCVGTSKVKSTLAVSGKRMAKLLCKAGSDPGFFLLDDKGYDI